MPSNLASVFPLWNGLPCNIVLTQSYEQFQDLLHKLYNINCDRILENSSKSHMKFGVFLHV